MIEEIQDNESIEAMLNRHFKETEDRLRKLIGTTMPVNEFQALCANSLESFVLSEEAEFTGQYDPLKEKLSSVQGRLADLKTNEQKLIESLRRCREHQDVKHSSIYHKLYYGGLVGSAVLVFSWRFKLIMPEQHPLIGVLQSVVMAAPSFLIAYSYEKSRNKDAFLGWLHKIGLTSAVLMTLGAAVSGVSANFLLSNATSSGSFLSGDTSSSWLEKLQLISSTICFITAIGVELAFGGRLLILINEAKAAKRPIEQQEEELLKTQNEISELEPESLKLAKKVSRMESFGDISNSWRESKLRELVVSHKVAQNEAYGKAMKEIGGRPLSEIIQLSNGMAKDKEKSNLSGERMTGDEH